VDALIAELAIKALIVCQHFVIRIEHHWHL